MKTILITYIYPNAIQYIQDFLSSLKKQSVNNFHLVIFNDGVIDAPSLFEEYENSFEVIEITGSISFIRIKSFEILSAFESDNFIFQDIDDEMSLNRIGILQKWLSKYALVCNDLSLIDSKGIPGDSKIWSARLTDFFEFDWRFLQNKNIVGFGNTGIRKELLQTEIKFSKIPVATDWFIFYQILFNTGVTALFTGECQTLYRQHDQNIAGIQMPDSKTLQKSLDVHRAHLLGLKEISIDVEADLESLSHKTIKNINPQSLTNFQQNDRFWWEEIQVL